MQFPIYEYPKSREAFQRALRVIPSGIYGHQGPSEGCYIPQSAFPLFSSHAKGAHFWDLDGNDFIDYMCGYGPNVLGYGDSDVDAAALEQRNKEDCVTAPSSIMVDFAELLVDTVASADWAFFAKNGSDVTTLAVLTARAATRRKKIIFFNGYYHGVHPWTQKLDYPGVLEEDVSNNLYVKFNDYPALEKLFSEYRSEIAGIIAQPYAHGNFNDNYFADTAYWQKVRKLCDESGCVLIVDDVRCGFRLDLAGSDHYFGFQADLICFCKALANGYNVSALCGRDSLRDVVSSLSF
ncbi:MAG: Aminotransferase class-III, partial [Bacillota bacterium]|nr:Aminotransferase class-III [Bacillota bacterium]